MTIITLFIHNTQLISKLMLMLTPFSLPTANSIERTLQYLAWGIKNKSPISLCIYTH